MYYLFRLFKRALSGFKKMQKIKERRKSSDSLTIILRAIQLPHSCTQVHSSYSVENKIKEWSKKKNVFYVKSHSIHRLQVESKVKSRRKFVHIDLNLNEA